MAEYTIRPIRVGTLRYFRGAFTSKQEQYQEREIFPIIIFLIQGNGRNILVDTGGGDPDSAEMKAGKHAQSFRSSEEAPDQALRAIGVLPEQIDTVILSHLHWDHCYNNHLFPQAEFYIQKKELMEAVCPQPEFESVYESFSFGLLPPWARQQTKWKVIDGAYDLCEGIRLLPLPGHSGGLQGVLVNTADGAFLLPSDAVPLYECIEGLAQGQYAISTLCTDQEKFQQTFDRMRHLQTEQNVRILASHDMLTLQHPLYPIK